MLFFVLLGGEGDKGDGGDGAEPQLWWGEHTDSFISQQKLILTADYRSQSWQ